MDEDNGTRRDPAGEWFECLAAARVEVPRAEGVGETEALAAAHSITEAFLEVTGYTRALRPVVSLAAGAVVSETAIAKQGDRGLISLLMATAFDAVILGISQAGSLPPEAVRACADQAGLGSDQASEILALRSDLESFGRG